MDGRTSPRLFRVRLNVERIRQSISAADAQPCSTADVFELLIRSGAARAPDGWWLIPEHSMSVVHPDEVEAIHEFLPV